MSYIIVQHEDNNLPTVTVKSKRTKCLAFEPTDNNVLVSGHAQYVRLYSGSLRSNDVVIASGSNAISIGGAHLKPPYLRQYPGNQAYLAVLCRHHTAFLQATGFERRAIVSLIQEELYKADPPARFIARRFGIQQSQQWLGMNDDQVAKRIQRDLLHNLVARNVPPPPPPPTTMQNNNDVTNNEIAINNKICVNAHPQQSHHQRTLPLRIVSPVVFDQYHNHGGSVATTETHVPAVMSTNVAEFLDLPCMAMQRSRLSDYNQSLLNCVELFQASEEGTRAGYKGKKQITIGQLGLRCRHCAAAAKANGQANNLLMTSWSPYSVSVPGRIQVMEFNHFQIASKHIVGGACVHIPHELRSQILASKRLSATQTKKRGGTGIQGYFNQVAALCGIQDTPGGMKLPSDVVVDHEEEDGDDPVSASTINDVEDEEAGANILETSASSTEDEQAAMNGLVMLANHAMQTPMANRSN